MSTLRQQRERAHFDQLADSTGEIWWGSTTYAGIKRLQRRSRLVANALSTTKQQVVLELGCGTGSFTRFLLEALPSVHLTACDISPITVERIRERYGSFPNTRFLAEDVCKLSMPDQTFDAVVGNSVLHHLPLVDALQEIRRVLKPGGVLWLSEPNMLNPQIALEKNVRWIGRRLQNSEDETAFFRWSLARVLVQQRYQSVSIVPYDFLHPIVPRPMVPLVEWLGGVLEKLPIVREVAGSLEIRAFKSTFD